MIRTHREGRGAELEEGRERGAEAPGPPERHAPTTEPARPGRGGRGTVLWFAVVGALWFDVSQFRLAAAMGGIVSGGALAAVTLAALLGRFLAQLGEAAFHALAWRALGRSVRVGPLWVSILTLSLCDALAESLFRFAEEGARGPWIALLVGFRALPNADAGALAAEPGVRVAFGSFGLLALARILGTAWAVRSQGPPFAGALGITLLAVGAGRIAIWWTMDLLRGMSPLP